MVYSVEELFYLWDTYGVFQFLLPFLLIFAIVYGILTYMGIFGSNKPAHVIIAVVVGLMAARFGVFTQFYTELFPRLGIGLVIVVALMILVGLFATETNLKTFFPWTFIIISFIVGIIVLYTTADYLGWTSTLFGYAGGNGVAGFLSIAAVVGIIIAVITAGSTNKIPETGKFQPWFMPVAPSGKTS